MIQIPQNWAFVDTPWDLTWECKAVKLGWTNATRVGCVMSTLLGVWSAYILPFVCGLSLIGYLFFIIILLVTKYLNTRQLIYMFCMFVANAATNVIFGWFWIFPAKGLPFATDGRVYMFSFYASTAACTFHRFAYSLTSTFSCNVLLLASIDRMLCVYFPMEFSNVPKRYGWYAVLTTLLISAFMLVPAVALIMWTKMENQITCWFPERYRFLEYYHALISNAGIIQPLLIAVINIIFIVRIRRYASQNRAKVISVQVKQSIQACVALMIFSVVYVICAIPQSIAYVCAYTISRASPSQSQQIRMAYNVADLSWNLYFLRDLIYLILMFRFTGILGWLFWVVRGRKGRTMFPISETFWAEDNMTIVQ